MLRYTTTRYVTLRYDTLCYATLHHVMLRYATLCYAMPGYFKVTLHCYGMLDHVTLLHNSRIRSATLRYAMLRYATPRVPTTCFLPHFFFIFFFFFIEKDEISCRSFSSRASPAFLSPSVYRPFSFHYRSERFVHVSKCFCLWKASAKDSVSYGGGAVPSCFQPEKLLKYPMSKCKHGCIHNIEISYIKEQGHQN